MGFLALPAWASWRHCGLRDGFEVVVLRPHHGGYVLDGSTTAVQDGGPWAVSYRIEVDATWATRRAEVSAHSPAGRRAIGLQRAADGRWLVDGTALRGFEDCLDVDLESSALTNALPVHRLGLEVGETASAPAVFVRAPELAVERLEQSYTRRDDEPAGQSFDYAAPRFDFRCRLGYDRHGLVLSYPGLATRVAA
jgi:hypothetical protein